MLLGEGYAIGDPAGTGARWIHPSAFPQGSLAGLSAPIECWARSAAEADSIFVSGLQERRCQPKPCTDFDHLWRKASHSRHYQQVHHQGKRLVVGAAIARDGKMLAARRIEPPSLAGGWELPGGKVDVGETPEEALLREIREELEVDVVLDERIGGDWPLGEHYVMWVWTARIVGDAEPVAAEQHDQIVWVDDVSFDTIGWLAGDVEPARSALRAITRSEASGAAPRLG